MISIESLLICNSNMFIPTVLSEVLSHPTKQYIILSDTPNITKLFSLLNIGNVIYSEYHVNYGRHIYREKKRLLGFLSNYKIKKVIFFHTEFGGIANWLIKELSKNISICYCKIYDSMPMPREKSFFKRSKIQLQEFLYWGVKVEVLNDFRPYPSLPKSFYKNVKAEEISIPIDMKIVSSYVTKKLGLSGINGEYVILNGTAVTGKLYTAERYEMFINEIIGIIGKEHVISKCHPRFNDLYGIERELKQIPSYIPGNILIDYFCCFIGFESTLLVEAAVAGKIAISLIDMLKPEEDIRLKFHDFFDSRLMGRGKIYFPTSIDDLKQIVKLEETV